MKGIQFKLQKVSSQIQAILIKPTVKLTFDIFELNFSKFSLQALNLAQQIISHCSPEEHVAAMFSKIISKLKQSRKYKPQADQEQDIYANNDQITKFLSSRKPINQATNIGQFNWFVERMEKKEKDTSAFLQNINNIKKPSEIKNKPKKQSQLTQTDIRWVKNLKIQQESKQNIGSLLSSIPYCEQEIKKFQEKLKQLQIQKNQVNKQLEDLQKRKQKQDLIKQANLEMNQQEQVDEKILANQSKFSKKNKKNSIMAKKSTKQKNQRNSRMPSNLKETGQKNKRSGSRFQSQTMAQSIFKKQRLSTQKSQVSKHNQKNAKYSKIKRNPKDFIMGQNLVNKQDNLQNSPHSPNTKDNKRSSIISQVKSQLLKSRISIFNKNQPQAEKLTQNNSLFQTEQVQKSQSQFQQRQQQKSNTIQNKSQIRQTQIKKSQSNTQQPNMILKKKEKEKSWKDQKNQIFYGRVNQIQSQNQNKRSSTVEMRQLKQKQCMAQAFEQNPIIFNKSTDFRSLNNEQSMQREHNANQLIKFSQNKLNLILQTESIVEGKVNGIKNSNLNLNLNLNQSKYKNININTNANKIQTFYNNTLMQKQKNQKVFTYSKQNSPLSNKNFPEQQLIFSNTGSTFHTKVKQFFYRNYKQNLPSLYNEKKIVMYKSQSSQLQAPDNLNISKEIHQKGCDVTSQNFQKLSLKKKDAIILHKINQIQRINKNPSQVGYYIELLERIHIQNCGKNCKHLQRYYQKIKNPKSCSRMAMNLPTRKIGFFS